MAPAAIFALLALTAPAAAQVLEVGDDGSVARYDAPAVFTSVGVAPIARTAVPAQGVRPNTPVSVHRELSAAAAAYDLSPALIEAVAWRESRLRQGAVSPAGAAGVMQLMPSTARDLGVDRFDLHQNVHGGAAYLSRLLGQFGGDLTLSLAAYNAGAGAVRRWGGVPPYAETRAYVGSILDRLADRVVAAP